MAVDSVIQSFGDLEKTVMMLRDRILRLLERQQSSQKDERILIALSGVPGSGKSTVGAALLREMPRHNINDVCILPMVSITLKKPAPDKD
jgi:pantothenate kinase-related protein Tda10